MLLIQMDKSSTLTDPETLPPALNREDSVKLCYPTIQCNGHCDVRYDASNGDLVSSSHPRVEVISRADDSRLILPKRYWRACGMTARKSVTDRGDGIPSEIAGEAASSEANRERDLGLALQWLKQEILSLKEQDKTLMRQFLELRSTIHKLRTQDEHRSRSSSSASGSDITDASGSCVSLDEGREDRYENGNGSRSNSLLRGEDYLGEFRGRTVSLLPLKPSLPLSVRRSRSKECF